MVENGPIRVGERVVHLQVPGVFTVIARRGRLLDLASPRGLQMTVAEVGVRRVDGTPSEPRES